jgi:hypothetical protein
VDVQLLRRSWYLDYLARSYPGLVARSKPEFDAFVAHLREWEKSPDMFARNPMLTQQIHAAFRDLIRSFVNKELQLAPVYITQDILFMTEGEDKELTQWLNDNYQAFPEGLIFELSKDRAFHELGDVRLETRGLHEKMAACEPDEVVNLKIAPVYKMMLLNRARYFAYFNRHKQAVAAFQQALAFDPDFALAKQGLLESMNEVNLPEPTQP